MFRYMADVMVWGMLLSTGLIVAAAMAENRGWHVVRAFLGMTDRSEVLDLYAEVERPDTTWNLLDELVEPHMDDAILDGAVFSSQARAAAAAALPASAPAVSFRHLPAGASAPHPTSRRTGGTMPGSVPPRRREPMPAAR